MKQTETNSYYIRSDLANVPLGGRFLFGLGLFVFIINLLSLITGRGQFDIYYIAFSIFLMFVGARTFFNIRRNHTQPFIVLGVEYFRFGWPGISIPYAAIEHFVFDQNQTNRTKVAFSLFPRPEEAIADIEGGPPVEIKEGRIVCQPVKLHGATAKTFFDDFSSRLISAGAINAMNDPKSVAGINKSTGEALILPKKPLSSELIKIGAFIDIKPRNLKWLSYRFGAFIAIFLVITLLLIRSHPQWNINLVDSIINSLFVATFVTLPVFALEEGLIYCLDRGQGIAKFMEKTGEMKKCLLGAFVGTAICLLAAWAFKALMLIAC